MKEKEEKASVGDIIETIIKIICTVALLLIIAILAIQRFSKNDIAFGGMRVFNIVSASMEPTYHIGDVILVKEVDTNSLKISDVISYQGKESDYAGKVITHRIKMIDETEEGKVFYTQGDATDQVDPAIKGDQIYGKLIYRFKIISKMTKLMNNLKAFYIFVFLPLGLLIFLQFKDSFTDKILEAKEADEDDDEDDEDDE